MASFLKGIRLFSNCRTAFPLRDRVIPDCATDPPTYLRSQTIDYCNERRPGSNQDKFRLVLSNADNRFSDDGKNRPFNFITEATWTTQTAEHDPVYNPGSYTSITVALEDLLPGMVTVVCRCMRVLGKVFSKNDPCTVVFSVVLMCCCC